MNMHLPHALHIIIHNNRISRIESLLVTDSSGYMLSKLESIIDYGFILWLNDMIGVFQ